MSLKTTLATVSQAQQALALDSTRSRPTPTVVGKNSDQIRGSSRHSSSLLQMAEQRQARHAEKAAAHDQSAKTAQKAGTFIGLGVSVATVGIAAGTAAGVLTGSLFTAIASFPIGTIPALVVALGAGAVVAVQKIKSKNEAKEAEQAAQEVQQYSALLAQQQSEEATENGGAAGTTLTLLEEVENREGLRLDVREGLRPESITEEPVSEEANTTTGSLASASSAENGSITQV